MEQQLPFTTQNWKNEKKKILTTLRLCLDGDWTKCQVLTNRNSKCKLWGVNNNGNECCKTVVTYLWAFNS